MFKLGVVGASVAIAALLAGSVAAAPRDNAFTVTNLVADSGSSAASDDVSLVNGWGLSAGPTTPWWVSDNGTNLSTLYAGTGGKQALTVTVAGGPTGTVFNGSATDFVFGIQALSGRIFVTYAKQDKARHDDVAGGGLGYVDEFTPAGKLVARVASGGRKNAPPNAPWGLALAPSSFGPFSGDVLVGNFGNGRISAYEHRGAKWIFRGQLRRGDDGKLIAIDGLWAIAFGNGSAAGPTTSLYFAAGPGGEAHGLFGSITAG